MRVAWICSRSKGLSSMRCHPRGRWNGSIIATLSLLLTTFIASGLLTGAPKVSAASGGTIAILGSVSGPVGALVTVEIRQYPSQTTSYILAATTTSPDQGGCGSVQSLNGVAPFQVDPNRGADVQFHWPASLGRGTYWFCATSGDGSAPAAMSLPSAPYTVLTGAAPTVRVVTPSSVAQPGATITVTLANWLTRDGGAPARWGLLRQGDAIEKATIIAAQSSGSGNPTAGTYTFTATLPSFMASGGMYAVVAFGECGADPLGTSKTICAVSASSQYFAVAQSPAPTPVPTSSLQSPQAGANTIEIGPLALSTQALLLALAIAATLLVAVVALVTASVRRSRARKRRSQPMPYAHSSYDQRVNSRGRRE